MKRIEYKATIAIINHPLLGSREEILAVWARNINSGFKKAADKAVKACLQDEEVHSLEFWKVG